MSKNAEYTIIALALANMQPGPNGKPWAFKHIEGCAVTSDACSGGLSWFYKLFMRQNISCHWVCVLHDFLYSVGGDDMAREFADVLLMRGAASAGKFEGWRAPFRRAWRAFRARVMFWAVRRFGGLFWSKG